MEKSSPMPFTDPFLAPSVPSVHSNHSDPIQVDGSATITETNEQATPTSDGGHAATLTARSTMDWQEGLTSGEFSLYPAANVCVRAWFQKYHQWFPILHRPSLREVSEHTLSRYTLVWKAIMVVVALNEGGGAILGHDVISHLQDQVLLQGMATALLQSIQGLLILCSSFFALGNMAQCWNMIAVCKRYGNTQMFPSLILG